MKTQGVHQLIHLWPRPESGTVFTAIGPEYRRKLRNLRKKVRRLMRRAK
jgi:hypothetical protein